MRGLLCRVFGHRWRLTWEIRETDQHGPIDTIHIMWVECAFCGEKR